MNGIVPVEQFKAELINQQSMIAEVLPKHMSVEKFTRAAIIAVTNTPSVLDADRRSLFNALQRCAVDGLVPDNREAALVEFNTKSGNGWIKKIQYMPMVDGVLKRARQSGEISTITARAVYENDEFDYWVDENGEHLRHRPQFAGSRGNMTMVYAMAKMKSGEVIVEPMNMEDIEKVKSSSKTSNSGPWVDWFERMAIKSSLHRLARRLPNSSEIMEMLDNDNWMYEFNKKSNSRVEKEVNPQAVDDEFISEDQAQEIRDAIEANNKDVTVFCKKFRIPTVEGLDTKRFSLAMTKINEPVDQRLDSAGGSK